MTRTQTKNRIRKVLSLLKEISAETPDIIISLRIDFIKDYLEECL